jgi:AcrR family transcriptional regulator
MGTNERKEREKLEIARLILESARRLFLEKGIEQTTIRNIAEAIDYSVGTVYVYYKDKNAILHALHQQGFLQLRERFSPLQHVADPMERLKAMGRLYIQFAQDNPEMYDLMFVTKAPMSFLDHVHAQEWQEGQATFDVLKQTVAQCIQQGHFKRHGIEQIDSLSMCIWAQVHGLVSLEIRNRIRGVNICNPDMIVGEAYARFIDMLE